MGEGWQLRVATPADHAAIVAIQQAEERHYRGITDFTAEFLRDQVVAASSFDPRDLVVAARDGQIVASAVVTRKVGVISLDPDHEDRALRDALLAWNERRHDELGRRPYRITTYASHGPGVGHLEDSGYGLERVYAQMVRDFGLTGAPEAPRLGDGYRIRRVDAASDGPLLHRLNEEMFAERPDHTPEREEDYIRSELSFVEFEPAWSLIVEGPDGEPAGSLIGRRPADHPHGQVAILGVHPAHRRRGLARAMLLTAFGTIHAADLPTAELYVASDNPSALELYTGIGMVPGERFNDYVREP